MVKVPSTGTNFTTVVVTTNKAAIYAAAEDMDTAERKMRGAEHKYLEKCGWLYTCATPGCFWLWQKALDDGRTLLTDRETALRIAATMNDDA